VIIAAQHRIFQFHFERLRRRNPAVNGERAAKHRRADRQQTAAVKLEQLRRRSHRGDRTFLVKAPPALGADIGAQNKPIPMRGHILEPPNLAAYRLCAHLLG
jgi:hypothetical protein